MRDQPRLVALVVPDPGQDTRLLRVSSGHACRAVSPSRAGEGRAIPTAAPLLSSGLTGNSAPEVTDGSERVRMPAPGTTGQKAGLPSSSVSTSQGPAPDPAIWARRRWCRPPCVLRGRGKGSPCTPSPGRMLILRCLALLWFCLNSYDH